MRSILFLIFFTLASSGIKYQECIGERQRNASVGFARNYIQRLFVFEHTNHMKNFFSNLFQIKDTLPHQPLTSPPKHYLVEKKVKEIIYASTVFSDMDFSELTGNVSQIVGVVGIDEDGEQIKLALLHQYYRFLYHHYWLNDSLTAQVMAILQIDAKDASDLLSKWPSNLTYGKFLELYHELKLELLSRVTVDDAVVNKYIVVLNPFFWDYQHRDNYNLLIDVTSTYERYYDKSSWIFDNEEDALNFAIITMEILSNHRGPDNSYYYSELVVRQFEHCAHGDKEELKSLGITPHTGLPWFTMDAPLYFTWSNANIASIAESRRDEMNMMKKIFAKIPNPPFYIIHNL